MASISKKLEVNIYKIQLFHKIKDVTFDYLEHLKEKNKRGSLIIRRNNDDGAIELKGKEIKTLRRILEVIK